MRLYTMGDGPLIVKIAGLAGGVRLYREEMEAAASAGFRVAALETSGDRREDPATGRLTWDLLAGEVARTLDSLGASGAILWGTSFGCLLALAAAARWPERTSGLLLSHPPDVDWRPRLYLRLERWASMRAKPPGITRTLFMGGFALLAGWEFLTPAALWRVPFLAREARRADTPAPTIADKLALLWHEDPGLPPMEANVPATIIAGAWDTVTPPALARSLARRLPGCRLRILGFAGHAGAFSRPAAYSRIAVEELRRLAEMKS